MYYQARERALSNGQTYHIAAILRRNKSIIRIGVNTHKTHPKFKRWYKDGMTGSGMHAEMDVLRFAQPGDELEVMRFRRCDHSLAMAKPCQYCMKHIREAGIKKVRYTDPEGNWKELVIE